MIILRINEITNDNTTDINSIITIANNIHMQTFRIYDIQRNK